jgi:hypothetical protein
MGKKSATALAVMILAAGACVLERRERRAPPRKSVAEILLPAENLPAPVDGIAAAILVDTSGSMKDPVADAEGTLRPKIEIARRAVLECLRQFQDFARKNPGRKVRVGVFEFSSRDRGAWCRAVVPLGEPDADAAAEAVAKMRPEGGTPIGDAMVQGKHALDRAGMNRQHLLVVTDGRNNRGYTPGDVAREIALLPEERAAHIHFIAFDVAAQHFQAVQEAGGLVLEASDERNLRQTLDFILTGRILAEEPSGAAPR